jgi:hypothetical protein
MKEVGELTVRSSRSSETIGTWLNLAFSLAVAEDIFPVSNLYLRSGISVSSPCVFHRGSLSFAGIISRKRHDLRPGRTYVAQKGLCRRCRALVEPD